MSLEIDTLIAEVEKRPGLYKKNLKEYSNIIFKKKLWDNVCEAVVPGWGELGQEEKTVQGHEVQRKWHNLRTCFRREVNAQKNTKSGPSSKRRKYIYFEKLLFLLPSLKSGVTESNIDSSEAHDEASKNGGNDEGSGSTTLTPRRRKSDRKSHDLEEDLLNALKKSETDEDTNFALSLVPSLRKLSQDEKLEAKIQILRIFKEIRMARIHKATLHVQPEKSITVPRPLDSQSVVTSSSYTVQQPQTFQFVPCPSPSPSSSKSVQFNLNSHLPPTTTQLPSFPIFVKNELECDWLS